MKIGVTQMTALLVAVLLVGCAPRLTRGESSGLKWHVTELTTSERPATYIGYKSDGRVKVYRYVVVLEENSGVGVNFGQVETSRRNVPSLSETPMINATSAVGHTALLIVDDRAEGSYAARPSRTNASPACHSWSVPVGATTTGGTAPVSSDV